MKTAAALLCLFAVLPLAQAEEHHHHHAFAADVDAFHAALAPVWHARPGPIRNRDTCAKAADFARLAGDIRSTDASALQQAIAALQATCKKQPNKPEAALHDVHEAFHRLIDKG